MANFNLFIKQKKLRITSEFFYELLFIKNYLITDNFCVATNSLLVKRTE